MKWRLPALAFVLLAGCHKATGYGNGETVAGTMRHLASLDILHRAMVAFCVLTVSGGAALHIYTVNRPQLYERQSALWVGALILLAVVFLTRTWLDFRYLRYCC